MPHDKETVELVARALCCPSGECGWGHCGIASWNMRATAALDALAGAGKLAGPDSAVAPRKLIREAHQVMRATGWHLALASEPISDDGVIEAACSEIEAQFAALAAAPSPGDVG